MNDDATRSELLTLGVSLGLLMALFLTPFLLHAVPPIFGQ